MNFKLSPEAIRLLCYQRSQYCNTVAAAYLTEMSQVYSQTKNHLPVNVSSILDIGAGMAGIDVFLGKHYPGSKITILDKEGYEENYKSKIGFHYSVDSFGPYHSFEGAKSLLRLNGITPTCIDIGKEKFPDKLFDLIVSFLSYGFHFPLATYSKNIKTPCTLILDIRKGTDDGSFGKGTVIHEGAKHERKLYKLC